MSQPDRAPVWPTGFTGSITHTGGLERGFAAAAVAAKRDIASVGLDAEMASPLDEPLAARILTEREQAWLSSLPAERRGLLAKLCFSAKEALYKCQYPLTQTFLGFHDVEVEIDLESAAFVAHLLKPAGSLAKGRSFAGRFLITRDLILTGVVEPAR